MGARQGAGSELVDDSGGVLSEISDKSFWVKGPLFDLLFVTGGAFFTLFVAALSFQMPQYLPLFLWIWLVVFEGSHFWATFSRTYIDTKFRSENKSLLLGSLVFFLFPALIVYADSFGSEVSYTTMYGFFIFVWSLYHNARQHYGFMSIYAGKAQVEEEDKKLMAKTLYFAVGAAQVYFLLNFKLQAVFGIEQAGISNASLGFLTTKLPLVISVGSLMFLIQKGMKMYQKYGAKVLVSFHYIAVCWLFYSLMFFGIAPMDKLFQSASGVETLMLIAIMNSLFHNIQYHAIVWYYGNKRYNEDGKKGFGIAKFANYKLFNYAGISLLLGAGFGYIAWRLGDWPTPLGSWEFTTHSSWAYVLFFGIIGHHFYLDQKIWRPSKSKELKGYLGLKK